MSNRNNYTNYFFMQIHNNNFVVTAAMGFGQDYQIDSNSDSFKHGRNN